MNRSKGTSERQLRVGRLHGTNRATGRGTLGATLCVVLLLATAASRDARAQELSGEMLQDQDTLQAETSPRSRGDWTIYLGGGAALVPRFQGSDRYRVAPAPIVFVNYKDIVLFGPGGLRLNAFRGQGFRAGPLIGFLPGRHEDADPHLSGLGNIAPSLTVGAFALYAVRPFVFGARVEQAVTHTDNGLLATLNATYRQQIIEGKLYFAAGPELHFANAKYDQSFFGVTGDQSAGSGLPTYTPGGGLRDYGFSATLGYRWTDRIFLRTFLNVRRLAGDDANSPIVQDKTQATVMVGVAYRLE